MTDVYTKWLVPGSWTAPAWTGFSVTPADSDLPNGVCKAIYVGTGGNVYIMSPAGDIVPFVNVANGTFMPVAAKQIRTTSTTASNIVALY